MATVSTSASSNSAASLNTKDSFLGHPKGLYVLFFTEMWERFSYYGMRALLVLYMTQYLLLDPARAAKVMGYTAFAGFMQSIFGHLDVQPMSSQIYGVYTSLVYFTPLFGGIIADKFWGQRKTVYLGAVLMSIGHFLMASESFFFIALLFLILGNGAFKPNISTQVGSLYPEGDPRVDGAYTIFYMGINLGAFFSPLICGTLGQTVGWHYGFGAAGVGMIVGLIVYHFGRHHLPTDRLTKIHEAHTEEQNKEPLNANEWKRIIALCCVCLFTILFWAVYEQQGNTMQLWADEKTNWTFLGYTMPSTWFQSFNPLMIFIFAPLLNMFWNSGFKRTGKTSTSIRKMAVGCILAGVAFIVMIVAAKVVGEDPAAKGSLLWLLLATWILTMGELYLSPIGLALTSKVAPAKLVSLMMGVYLLSSCFGNYLAGYIGSFYSVMSKDSFFILLCALGIGTSFMFLITEKIFVKNIGRV